MSRNHTDDDLGFLSKATRANPQTLDRGAKEIMVESKPTSPLTSFPSKSNGKFGFMDGWSIEHFFNHHPSKKASWLRGMTLKWVI